MLQVRYTRNLFLRGICIIYLFAFLSFYVQIPGKREQRPRTWIDCRAWCPRREQIWLRSLFRAAPLSFRSLRIASVLLDVNSNDVPSYACRAREKREEEKKKKTIESRRTFIKFSAMRFRRALNCSGANVAHFRSVLSLLVFHPSKVVYLFYMILMNFINISYARAHTRT